MVYVNPDPAPPESFDEWIANLDDHAWPHDLGDGTLSFTSETTYEMRCNWKVFYENAVDGYHLGYLHDRTLGPLYPDRERGGAASAATPCGTRRSGTARRRRAAC